jgi:integrase
MSDSEFASERSFAPHLGIHLTRSYICSYQVTPQFEDLVMRPKKNKSQESVWVVQIYEEDAVERKNFETETAAVAWAANFAREVNTKAGSDFYDLTFLDLMNRFLDEVSIKTIKHPKNVAMVKYFSNTLIAGTTIKKYPIMGINLQDLCKQDFIDFRNIRTKEVGDGTFRRDWSRFHNAMSIASGEWGWIHRNIMKGIRVPTEPAHRCRRVSTEEQIAIREFLIGTEAKKPSVRKIHLQVAILFQLAIETALRFSELISLKKEEIYLEDGYLNVTGVEPNAKKSNSAIRSVPLTPLAKSLLSDAISFSWNDDFIFSVSHRKANQVFRGACQSLSIKDLHFHDSRHEATSQLAKIYNVLELAKIIGHRDVQSLMTYYQPTINELVSKMKVVA